MMLPAQRLPMHTASKLHIHYHRFIGYLSQDRRDIRNKNNRIGKDGKKKEEIERQGNMQGGYVVTKNAGIVL